ncbi:cap binding protein 80-PB [Heliocybe sulcata]|uniref:Cap binding protein 80-PB n=1 Tax=Heliocybe sulcata TaxID=5364 RepID=A0A5C3NFQ7_9AGAM|nr:cap binding protein 80-PB [Heliocybe sulcata]
MSYDRPYNNRRRNRDDYERREVYETPEQKLRTAIIRLGEVDVVQEIPRVVKQIREQAAGSVPAISEGFRIGVTEQPYKIPYYANLLRLLHDPAEGEPEPSTSGSPSLGKQILEDFWKGFQAFLDKLSWRETRLCIHFFAHLTMAKVITVQSMSSLLQSFVAVLDEFGVSHGRAKRAGLCAAEGLMIAGKTLKEESVTNVTDIIDAIQTYIESTASSKRLVQPVALFHANLDSLENADELLESALAVLKALNSADFSESVDSYPQPYADLPDLPDGAAAFELPSVLVPPEIIELDGLSADTGEEAQVKKEEWPEYYIRLFENEVTPNPVSPAGYAVRSALLDIVEIFEVNRKECARLLLEYPKWTLPGTFKPRPGTPAELQPEPVPGKNWQLESALMEIVLGALFVLPQSTYKAIYYIGLITEICKLSPSTVGPAVGKSIRKLYASLADGLDVEIGRRFAEWFAIHMSNFGFQWVWKEWVSDLSLSHNHPKRGFARRAVEFEIRLAYFERIAKTLPEAFQAEGASVLPEHAPGPDFEYDEPSNPYHNAAQSVLNLLKGRAKADDVLAHLESLKTAIGETADGDVNVDAVGRSVAVQSLLNIGSRSFSHFLNAIERYLPVLRSLAQGGPEAKTDILTAVSLFWKRNRQMIAIVFDKLMQYQIVDPTDVVGWTFTNGVGNERGSSEGSSVINAHDWDLLKGALDKANGRVLVARRRVTALRKEEDDTRARAKASGGGDVASMEVDAEIKPDEPESAVLTTAVKAFTSLTSQQKSTLARALEGFITCLGSASSDGQAGPVAPDVVTEKAWHNRANWTDEEWNTWETWGWYRHFCRAYSPYLRNYSTTLGTVSLNKLEGSTDPAALQIMKIWNVATGEEA